jgi:hypothetical protein
MSHQYQIRTRTCAGAWNKRETFTKNLSVPNKTSVGRVPGVCFFMVTCSILYGIPCSLVPVPERFFGRKKKSTCFQVLPPRPQHLAEGLHEHLVKGGLIDWYLEELS